MVGSQPLVRQRASQRPRLVTLLPLVAVVCAAIGLSFAAWHGPVRWSADPDSLRYQANVLALRGDGNQLQLARLLFAGPKGATYRRADARRPPSRRHYTDAWLRYSSRFFRRRLFVPLMAAAAYPVLGDRSLLTVSLVGYVLLTAAVYALLRRRFGLWTSAAAASVIAAAPPVRAHSFLPMADSWSIVLETIALLVALLVLDGRTRWLPVWIATMTAASFTRDVTVVPLVALLLLTVQQRSRQAVALLVSGGLAIVPALALYGNSSVRNNLAFVFSDYNPPKDQSWSFVLHSYLPHIRMLLHKDFLYGRGLGWQQPLWYLGVAAGVVGLPLLLRRAADGDAFFALHAYAIVGAALFVALFADYSEFREELTFVPPAAVSLALLGDAAARHTLARPRTRKAVRDRRLDRQPQHWRQVGAAVGSPLCRSARRARSIPVPFAVKGFSSLSSRP
jgi:hypothetical protein